MIAEGRAGAAIDRRARFPAWRFDAPAVAAALLAISYAALLAWFWRKDFYHTHFFVRGAAVQIYQVARLAFIAWLGWLIYAVGAGATKLIFGGTAFSSLAPFERYPLFFILGAGIWHGLLFATGLAGLDTKPVMVALTLGVMLVSVPHLARCLREARAFLQQARGRGPLGLARSALLVGIAQAAIVFLLVKGLYPAGGHDYYDHYFQFYKRVVETGSILPNDVWYHFFYSKGAGLYFMGMLLTDPLAPQLVTTAFIGCGAAIIFALLNRSAPRTLLPAIGVLLYVALLIYTPGPDLSMANGGWGDLEKIHEITAVLVLAIVWISARLVRGDVKPQGPWWLALSAAIVGTALLTPALELLVGLHLGLLMVWLATRGRWRRTYGLFAAAVLAGASLLAVFAINYHYTGMPTDLFIVRLWPYFDLNKIQAWGTLYEVLDDHRSYYGQAAGSATWSWNALPLYAEFLRLELWWPLIAAALLPAVFNLSSRERRLALAPHADAQTLMVLAIFGLAVTLVATASGSYTVPQSISFYRFSSFAYGPALCAALLLWPLALSGRADERRIRLALCAVSLLGSALIFRLVAMPRQWNELAHDNFTQILVRAAATPIVSHALKLAGGEFSLRDAYQNQEGWPGRKPWGGIHPAMEKVREIVGPRSRIWSFHIDSYCMLPDCNVQGSISFRFSPSWQTVIFGAPKQASDRLKREGLNYFFFSRELGTSRTDLLPVSQLFAPDQIGNYLGIKWTDGTSYLLTWLGPDVQPISPAFLAGFRARFEADGYDIEGWRQLWGAVSDYVTAHKDDLRPFAAPWCTPSIRCQ